MAIKASIDPTALTGGKPADWRTVERRLEEPAKAQTYWLATVRPDGRPHVMPLIGIWDDGAFYFVTGESTRKGRNLVRDGHCVVAGNSTTIPSVDIILEGEARKVTDPHTLRRVVKMFANDLKWPLEERDGAVAGPNAPTAGPPPYSVFELAPTTAFGLPGTAGMEQTPSEDRVSPTRWDFEESR